MILTRAEQDAIETKLIVLHLEIREYLWASRDSGEANAYLEQTKLAHARLKAVHEELQREDEVLA